MSSTTIHCPGCGAEMLAEEGLKTMCQACGQHVFVEGSTPQIPDPPSQAWAYIPLGLGALFFAGAMVFGDGPATGLAGALLIVFLLSPIIIAQQRHHRRTWAIALLTIGLGWTIIGWLVALIWAFMARRARRSQ